MKTYVKLLIVNVVAFIAPVLIISFVSAELQNVFEWSEQGRVGMLFYMLVFNCFYQLFFEIDEDY